MIKSRSLELSINIYKFHSDAQIYHEQYIAYAQQPEKFKGHKD